MMKPTFGFKKAWCWKGMLAVWLGLVFVCLIRSPHLAVAMNLQWCPQQCDCNQYNTVDCSRMDLQHVPAVSNMTTRLYMEYNMINEIPADAFLPMPNLLVLNIQQNLLTELHTDYFCVLHDIQEINLSGNRISTVTISLHPDCMLTKLKLLDLSNNRIISIPSNISHFAPNLEIFNLSLNDINTVTLEWGFASMKYLSNLDFYGNDIGVIKAQDFEPLRMIYLQVLRLSDCNIGEIDAGTLRGFLNLTWLSLDRNLLAVEALEGLLSGLGNQSRLTYLSMRNMVLPNLTLAMVQAAPELVHLDAAYNRLQHVHSKLFSALPSLETLQLDANQLETLDGLHQMPQLRRLYVHSNRLQRISLQGLTNLEHIDLSENELQVLPENWLHGLDMLQILNLSHNLLWDIHPLSFQQVALNTIDLSGNQLTTLHGYGQLKVRKLYVAHNDIQDIVHDTFQLLSGGLEELDLSHNNLTHFPEQALDEFVSLQQLNLASNHLGPAFRQGSLGSLFHSLGHLQILDLSYNNISILPHQQFQYLHHLTTLYLQGNHVDNLAHLSLPDMNSLAKLVVSNNRLQGVQTQVLASLSYLEVVDLSQNPYQCTCDLLPYIHWLNHTMVTVLDLEDHSRYQCWEPTSMHGSYILSYNPTSRDCMRTLASFSSRIAIAAIILSCVAITAVVLVCALCYHKLCHRLKSLHYRWQIRYREVSGVEIASDPKT